MAGPLPVSGRPMMETNWKIKGFVRSGIRTHAHRSGLRPERSALDRSAILTTALLRVSCEKGADFQFGVDEKKTWRIRVSIPVPLAC